MKKLVKLLFVFGMIGTTAFSQSQSVQVAAKASKVRGIHPDYRREFIESVGRTTNCGTDELEYAAQKLNSDGTIESAAFGASFNQRAYGQIFEVPTGKTVNITGVQFWGSAPRESGVVTTDVRVDIYNVNSNQVPSGVPANSFTYTMDSSSFLKPYSFDFPTSVARTDDFCMVITALSDSVSFIMSNDWNKGDGRNENLNSWLFASGNWLPGTDVIIDFNDNRANGDWFIEPRVDYTYDASIVMNAASGCVLQGTDVEFTAILDPILQSRFYNRYAFNAYFNGAPDSTAQWDFNGDGNIDTYGSAVTWNYPSGTGNGMVEVQLNAVNNGYDANGFCTEMVMQMFPSGGEANALFTVDELGEREVRVVAAFKEDFVDSYTWDWGDGTADSISGDTAFHTYSISDTFEITLTALNCGSSDVKTEKVFVAPATSVTSELFNTFDIFPNPVTDVLNLKFKLNKAENVSVKLMDISGRTVARESLDNVQAVQSTLDMSKLERGIYIVAVQAGEEASHKKIVLE